MIRSILLTVAILLAPMAASSQYIDAIVNEINEGCTLDKYLEHVEEFRAVLKAQGYTYTVEIAQPLMNQDLSVVYWIGRTKDLATYGAEYTRWEKALEDPGSPESKVNTKLDACAANRSRSGALVR